MLKALERNIAAVGDRMVLLAPTGADTSFFKGVEVDLGWHQRYVRAVQAFRGAIYLHDGAISESDLAPGGLHRTREDDRSWHMVLLDHHDRVTASALYLEHESHSVSIDSLRANTCPLATQPETRTAFRRAMAIELDRARRDALRYAELGGWAVAEECRGTAGPLAMALAVYGFSRRCGGALGMTTATFRHCSATILKRLGGSPFEADGAELPPYFDSRYNCMMEMLRFDSRNPNPKYVSLIDELRERLASVRVIARPAAWAVDSNVRVRRRVMAA